MHCRMWLELCLNLTLGLLQTKNLRHAVILILTECYMFALRLRRENNGTLHANFLID